MTRDELRRHPLLAFLLDNLASEESRHEKDVPNTLTAEMWRAQVDAFSSRLYNRMNEAAIKEMTEAIGPVMCLHKMLAAYKLALDHAAEPLNAAVMLLTYEDALDGGPEPPPDAGGEA